jgi:hypothetical protein
MSSICSCSDPTTCSCNQNLILNPADQGRQLEDIIHTAALKIPGVTRALKELDIRTHFGDSSLNGVDHMISINSTHILIQDKWKETITQQEVSQFITCAERIQTRLTGDNKIYLIWVSKKEPTANSAKMLRERNVSLVCCGISLEALARCAILQICECIPISPIEALLSIESTVKPEPMSLSRHLPVSVAPIIVAFDETAEGKREIDAMKQFITSIRNGILQRAENAMRMDGIADIYTLWSYSIPKSLEDWWNGSMAKVDFNAYLKTIKNICWPTNKKHLPFRNLCYYTKLRKLSGEFAPLAQEYETRRRGLLAKKSVWAKALLAVKAIAEIMTEAEFKGGVINTIEYLQEWPKEKERLERNNRLQQAMNNEDGPGKKYLQGRINTVSFTEHFERAFHTHQCTPY